MKNLKVWYLKQIHLFKDLNQKQLEYVSSCFHNKYFKKGQEIPGVEKDNTIFLLKQGVIELYTISADGRKIIVDILSAGSVFGNLPRDKQDISLYATVRKDSILCHMPTKDFFKLISAYPAASEKLLKALYAQMVRQKERISSLAAESVPQRLLRIVKMLSTDTFRKQHIVFTHEEIAQMIGTSRQTVTTLLNSLVKDGKLKKVGRQYQLVG